METVTAKAAAAATATASDVEGGEEVVEVMEVV